MSYVAPEWLQQSGSSVVSAGSSFNAALASKRLHLLPIEKLMMAVAAQSKHTIVAHGEAPLSESGVRPDHAIRVVDGAGSQQIIRSRAAWAADQEPRSAGRTGLRARLDSKAGSRSEIERLGLRLRTVGSAERGEAVVLVAGGGRSAGSLSLVVFSGRC